MADGVAARWNQVAYEGAQERLLDNLMSMGATGAQPRPGRRPGAGLEVSVATGPDRVIVQPGVGVIVDSVGGGYRFGFGAAVTKNLSARPASGVSRVDAVIARVYDVDVDPSDAVRECNVEVIDGDASASPTAPATPDGALLLATLTVPASGAIAITRATARTVAPGGLLPVANQDERDAILGAYNGLQVFREDLGHVETRVADAWQTALDDQTTDPVNVPATSPYTSTAQVIRVRNLVLASGGFNRNTGTNPAFVQAGVIPAGFRPSVAQLLPASTYWGTNIQHQVQILPSGAVQVRQEAASALGALIAGVTWVTTDAMP